MDKSLLKQWCSSTFARSLFGLLFLLQVFTFPQRHLVADETTSLDLLVRSLHQTERPEMQAAILRGIQQGLDGRKKVTPPKGWESLSNKLQDSPDKKVRESVFELSQLFGDQQSLDAALNSIQDPTSDVGTRRSALQTLLSLGNQDASDRLEMLLDDKDLCIDAIRGFAQIENAIGPGLLLERYDRWDDDKRRAVLETLATRKRYAQSLLDAIKIGRVDQDDVPVHVTRSLYLLLGDAITEVFGDVRQLDGDRRQSLQKYKKLCTPEALERADSFRGRAVFEKTCAACHVLFGSGGKIGPELTGSNRANLDYILLNSVDPSYDVPDGYKMQIIQTDDGRLVSGVVAEEDSQRVVLKTIEQPRLVILKDEIEARKTSPKSMMPDGQLDAMKPQEVLDLIKYLRSPKQVERSDES